MEEMINSLETISSIEISKITGKRHDHVLRDIKRMLTELNLDLPKFGGIYTDAQNRTQNCFNLPKRESLILASGYDILLRTRIIDRWIELETKTPTKQLSRKDLAYMIIEAEEKAEKLQLEIDTKHKPRSQFVDQVFNSDSLITVGQAAKSLKLGFGRNTLFKKLRESGVFFKNSNEPKQYYVSKGYFEVKEKMYSTDNGDKIKLQTFVTQKGLGFLAKQFGVVQLPINKTKYLSA